MMHQFSATDKTRATALLVKVCQQSQLHARLLNTLSLMEHVGSRKIMASQSKASNSLSCEILRHLAEETRHAYFFKRAAESIAAKPLSYGDDQLIAAPQARLYMGKLDAFVSRSVGGPAAYLYVTLTVELRAVWFYKIYQAVLTQLGQSLSLKSLVAEEQQHLSVMGGALSALGENMDARIAAFQAFEGALYQKLLTALEQSVLEWKHCELHC